MAGRKVMGPNGREHPRPRKDRDWGAHVRLPRRVAWPKTCGHSSPHPRMTSSPWDDLLDALPRVERAMEQISERGDWPPTIELVLRQDLSDSALLELDPSKGDLLVLAQCSNAPETTRRMVARFPLADHFKTWAGQKGRPAYKGATKYRTIYWDWTRDFPALKDKEDIKSLHLDVDVSFNPRRYRINNVHDLLEPLKRHFKLDTIMPDWAQSAQAHVDKAWGNLLPAHLRTPPPGEDGEEPLPLSDYCRHLKRYYEDVFPKEYDKKISRLEERPTKRQKVEDNKKKDDEDRK